MIAVWLFLVVTWVCLQFVIVVFPDHTHLLFLNLTILDKHLAILNTVYISEYHREFFHRFLELLGS